MSCTGNAKRHAGRRRPSRQGGAFLLPLLALLAGGGLVYAIAELSLRATADATERATQAALARARDALVGRAVTDDNRPGSLPCPALDEGGQVALFVGNRCPAYVGRFPWKAMKTGELRDGHGELLWYALAPALRDHPAVEPLDGRAPALLTVAGTDGIAAAIIAAGPPLAGQARHPASAVADHLDGTNADGDAIYAMNPPSATFNDRLLPLSRDALFRPVGRRVLAEIRGPDDRPPALPAQGLRHHHRLHGRFPWADRDGDGHADDGAASGGVPYRALQLPEWLARNGWFAHVAYRRVGDDAATLEFGGDRREVAPCIASPCP